MVNQEPTEELKAGQLATARLLLLISAGPAGEKEEALISSVDAPALAALPLCCCCCSC